MDKDAIRAALVERILSGEPFTHGVLIGWCAGKFGPGDYFRLIDRTVQSVRREGKIAFTREGRGTVWRMVDAPKSDPMETLLTFAPSALKCSRCDGTNIHIVLNRRGTTIIVSCTDCDKRTEDDVLHMVWPKP